MALCAFVGSPARSVVACPEHGVGRAVDVLHGRHHRPRRLPVDGQAFGGRIRDREGARVPAGLPPAAREASARSAAMTAPPTPVPTRTAMAVGLRRGPGRRGDGVAGADRSGRGVHTLYWCATERNATQKSQISSWLPDLAPVEGPACAKSGGTASGPNSSPSPGVWDEGAKRVFAELTDHGHADDTGPADQG